jgi:hypothetical protein
MSSEHQIKEQYTENCRCRKCGTYAKITEYYCGCVKVEIYNAQEPCSDCTNFSGRRYTAYNCR